jgi:hypothetical protein
VLARAGARSARVAESDGAAGQAFTGPRDFGPLGISTHIGAGARRDRFSTIDNRGRRCLREPAHGLREWPRAMARRGRRLPDLGISAPSVVACILAWAGDATDFRPSIIGVGGACASRRTVCESGRERWRGGAGVYPTSGFRPTHHNTRPTRALTECNSHLFTLTRPLGRRFGVPRRQDSDACMCARATRHAMQAPDRARRP